MVKFAVVLQPGNEGRVVENHPVLRRLPVRIAVKCLPYLSTQKTGMIMDNENQEKLGCLIDVPGFFSNWSQQKEVYRLRAVKALVKSLIKWKIPVLSFPFLTEYLHEEERRLFENSGIILLDGFHHRLAGLMLVVKQLLHITEKEVPYYEIGIWGADTDIGQIWAGFLATEVNHMCIGGHNYRELEKLADYILKTTGLSCQITIHPDLCLIDKNITIMAEHADIHFKQTYQAINVYSVPGIKYHTQKTKGKSKALSSFQQRHPIEAGWMSLPKDIKIDQELNPYEQLGVLEALFYAYNRRYRDDILNRRISLDQMNQLFTLYELLHIRPQGFVQDGRRIHFDRFRRGELKK